MESMTSTLTSGLTASCLVSCGLHVQVPSGLGGGEEVSAAPEIAETLGTGSTSKVERCLGMS